MSYRNQIRNNAAVSTMGYQAVGGECIHFNKEEIGGRIKMGEGGWV
jgi:hypothetical protein